MAEKLNPIPVEFVVDFAREFSTAKLREPYVQLINRWALHEKQATEGLEISGQLKDASQKKDPKRLLLYLYPKYREGEKLEQLKEALLVIDAKIHGHMVLWTWAYVMRVMVDENILTTKVVSQFDELVCGLISKGKDTVRKNGDYSKLMDRKESYHFWPKDYKIGKELAHDRFFCYEVFNELAAVLGKSPVDFNEYT